MPGKSYVLLRYTSPFRSVVQHVHPPVQGVFDARGTAYGLSMFDLFAVLMPRDEVSTLSHTLLDFLPDSSEHTELD